MNKEQFMEQFNRMSTEWPRAYGQSKAEMFAKEFGGHEYLFFKEVVDQLLRKSRYAPQVTDIWSTISEVQGSMFEKKRRRATTPQFKHHGGDCLPPKENLRRWALLLRFVGNKDQALKDPDWLRQQIWPNESKEESEKKYAKIIQDDEIMRKNQAGY